MSTNLDTNCQIYIKNHHSLMWYYYLTQVYFQMFAILSHIFKFLLYMFFNNKPLEDNDLEKQKLINKK